MTKKYTENLIKFTKAIENLQETLDLSDLDFIDDKVLLNLMSALDNCSDEINVHLTSKRDRLLS